MQTLQRLGHFYLLDEINFLFLKSLRCSNVISWVKQVTWSMFKISNEYRSLFTQNTANNFYYLIIRHDYVSWFLHALPPDVSDILTTKVYHNSHSFLMERDYQVDMIY
jgi:hypothetical protein